MSTIVPTVTAIGLQDGSTQRATWAAVTENDSCAAIAFPEFTDRSVQAAGTFGGASVAVHGSNDGTNFSALDNPSGTAIALTGSAISQILENTALVKPVITGGTAQSLTITMIVRLLNPLRH